MTRPSTSSHRIWLNGEIRAADDAVISVLDRGFTLGDGLFETLRAYNGRVFRLDDHLARLARGAERIGLPLPEDLAGAIDETLEANGLTDAAVRLTVSRGPAPHGLGPPDHPEPTCVITARPPPEPPESLTAITASGRLNEHSPTAGLKRLGFLDSIVALQEARRAGCDDAILLDTEEHVAEGTASNLFVVHDGQLLTPPPECGILEGITRTAVLEIAAALDLPAAVESIQPHTLHTAEEAFLTSTLREVVPLISLDGRRMGNGEPGPWTREIRRAYTELARSAG